ncbi:DUF1648 domain-containing protein [Halobaculum limi]|uniref:DUF1648 domain-containing protein n=1 Tax=Halobaculum limi TaxID=3031916 RepID=UPI002405CBB9|nr:DUF1648 domain-containing protein [Halobaculum sp. YSMS11]
MDTDPLRPADVGSIAAIALSLVVGLVAFPALPAEVAIQWAADGSPNTVLPVLPGISVIPAFALLAFVYLRGGTFFKGRNAELEPTTGLAVVAGVAYLQVALITLNLGVAVSPLVAVAPAVAVILVATYAGRFGAAGGT